VYVCLLGIDGPTDTTSRFVGWFVNGSYSVYLWLPTARQLYLGFSEQDEAGADPAQDNVRASLACVCSVPGVPWLFRGVPWPCSVVFRGVCRGVPGVFRGCAVVVKKNYPPLGGCVGIFLGGSVVRLFFGPARSSFLPNKGLFFFWGGTNLCWVRCQCHQELCPSQVWHEPWALSQTPLSLPLASQLRLCSAVTCASASAVTFLHACVVHPTARSGTRQGNGRPAGTGEGLV